MQTQRLLSCARAGSSPLPLRVAFVGQALYFKQCSMAVPTGGLTPVFVDFRAGSSSQLLLSQLARIDPDVVVVFRPEIIPPGLFGSLRATTIGYLTEPLPRGEGSGHRDLHERMWWLKQVDPGNFDRIVSFDPLIAETAESVLAVWRSVPIPVEDSLFMNVRERGRRPSLLFVGRSTEHREALLAPIKRSHPLVHVGHGLFGAALERFLRRADVQLNLHNNPYPTFENRVCVGLAAGHLLISEPLSPRHELRPAHDYLEVEGPHAFKAIVDELADDPAAHRDIQWAGREQAERFRASRVYPVLIRDALADIAARGSARCRLRC